MMGIAWKIFEVVKIALPFVKGASEKGESLSAYMPSKRLLINLPILFATVVLGAQGELTNLGLSPDLLLKLTALANLTTMFWDYWKKASQA